MPMSEIVRQRSLIDLVTDKDRDLVSRIIDQIETIESKSGKSDGEVQSLEVEEKFENISGI